MITSTEVEFDEMSVCRGLCRDDYYFFMKEFWNVVVPEPFLDNWHLRYIARELQFLVEWFLMGLVPDHDPIYDFKPYDLVINVSPGSTKPVWDQSPVLMADGRYKKLKNIKVGDYVIGKSGNACKVTGVHIQGELPCVSIKTYGGRDIKAAYDHPILTADGWVKAKDIIENQYLALMHKAKIQSATSRSIDEFRLAGYLIGDGCLAGHACNITNTDPEYIEDIIGCLKRLDFGYSIYKHKTNSKYTNEVTRISLKSKKANGSNKGKYKGMGRGYRESTGPQKWIKEKDVRLKGKTSYTKSIPKFVWKGSDDQIRAFLAAYFHCDGCVSIKGGKNTWVPFIGASTVSKKLAYGLQRLFLRLGIQMTVRRCVAKSGFTYNRDLKNYVTYLVVTSNSDAAVQFLKNIPLIGKKRKKILEWIPIKRLFRQKYLPDRVKEVVKIGKLPCRCLSVDKDNSFIVDGVVVHNSLQCSVFLQPWVWTRFPSAGFIESSYQENLSIDLSRKARIVVKSEKYRKMFPEIVISDDQDAKGKFANTEQGERNSVGNKGGITGRHADFIVIDDPIDPKGSRSEAEMTQANQFITETLWSRKKNKARTPTILVMQRLHQFDPTAMLLEMAERGETKIKHLCFPATLTEDVKPTTCRQYYKNNLFDPVRLPQRVLDEAAMQGEYSYAGQFLQRPVPIGGGMFKTDNIIIKDRSDVPALDNRWVKRVRYWDKAATEGGGAFTVGFLLGKDEDQRFWILDVLRGRWDSAKREGLIKSQAFVDGTKVVIGVEQEPGSAGKDSAQMTVGNLAGFRVVVDRPTGNKEERADPFSTQVNAGNVYMVRGLWNRACLDEMALFPNSKFKDQVDAGSGAFKLLTLPVKNVGGWRKRR